MTLFSPTGEVLAAGIVRHAKQRNDNRGIGGAASGQGKRYLLFRNHPHRPYSVFRILFNGYRMVQSLGSESACRLQCVLLIYALSTAAVLRTKSTPHPRTNLISYKGFELPATFCALHTSWQTVDLLTWYSLSVPAEHMDCPTNEYKFNTCFTCIPLF